MSNMKYMYNVQYMYNRRICLVSVEYLVPSPSICRYYSRMFREGLSYARLGQSPSILTYSIRASCGVKGCLRWIHSFLLYPTKVHREAAGVSHSLLFWETENMSSSSPGFPGQWQRQHIHK